MILYRCCWGQNLHTGVSLKDLPAIHRSERLGYLFSCRNQGDRLGCERRNAVSENPLRLHQPQIRAGPLYQQAAGQALQHRIPHQLPRHAQS